jgi:hypothetical protein
VQYEQPFDQPTNPTAPYVNGNPAAGIQGSIPPAAVFQNPQTEIINLITAGGITPSDGDLNQLGESVQNGKINFSLDTGTANALAITLPSFTPNPPPAGMPVRFKKGSSPTSGAATVSINSLAGLNLLRPDGSALTSDAPIPAGAFCETISDGAGALRLVAMPGAANSTFPGANGSQEWSAHGTYTFTVPAGIYVIFARVVGAGGGGGSANGTTNAGTGGGAGGYQEDAYPVTPGQVITVVVGEGGTGGATGGGGGTTSIGAFLSATGGGGGSDDGVSGGSSGGGFGGTGAPGGGGGSALATASLASAIGGTGGGSWFGSGGLPNGGVGSPPGTGGAGGGLGDTAGGTGQDGFASIQY